MPGQWLPHAMKGVLHSEHETATNSQARACSATPLGLWRAACKDVQESEDHCRHSMRRQERDVVIPPAVLSRLSCIKCWGCMFTNQPHFSSGARARRRTVRRCARSPSPSFLPVFIYLRVKMPPPSHSGWGNNYVPAYNLPRSDVLSGFDTLGEPVPASTDAGACALSTSLYFFQQKTDERVV